jgi:iron-sulfur cluster repair protein YtfE (RIC family)
MATKEHQETLTAAPDEAAVLAMTIRELVERYPETMEVLAPLGIDLCCGGAHQVGEALELHHADREVVVPRLLAAIAQRAGR